MPKEEWGCPNAYDREALCWNRLRFVEVGRLRIGAFEPVSEHGPRSSDCEIGDVGRNEGRDPVREITHLHRLARSSAHGSAYAKQSAKNTELSLENIEPNAAGIDVGGGGHGDLRGRAVAARSPAGPQFSHLHRRPARHGGLAGPVWHHHRGHGIDRRLPDSAAPNPGRGRHPRLPGQLQTRQARARAQVRRKRLPVVAIPALGRPVEGLVPPRWAYLRHPLLEPPPRQPDRQRLGPSAAHAQGVDAAGVPRPTMWVPRRSSSVGWR